MKNNFFANLIGGILALVALTGVIAIGVKLGNNGLKDSIKDWKDEIKDLTSSSSSEPSSSTPSPSTSSESTSSNASSGAFVASHYLTFNIEN